MRRPPAARRLPPIALALAGLCVLAGCQRGPSHVHFVLPEGYRGPFKVVVTPRVDGGYERAPDRYVLTIPEDGVLTIGDAWPLRRQREVTAAYARGGRPIASGDRKPASDDALRLVRLGDERSEQWWAVGNAGETSFVEKLWSDGALPTLNVMVGPSWPSRPGELQPLDEKTSQAP